MPTSRSAAPRLPVRLQFLSQVNHDRSQINTYIRSRQIHLPAPVFACHLKSKFISKISFMSNKKFNKRNPNNVNPSYEQPNQPELASSFSGKTFMYECSCGCRVWGKQGLALLCLTCDRRLKLILPDSQPRASDYWSPY